MSVVDRYLANPDSRWNKFRLWLWVTLPEIRDWFLRWIYAQHNARVIADFEDRMSAVLCEASGHLLSKPYYDRNTMLRVIADNHSRLYDEGYAEGRKDALEEHGLEEAPMK
jgi:hypothetical protein